MPLRRDARPGWRNRYLGLPTGDQDREDHAERVLPKGRAGEHEPEAVAHLFHPARDARIGRLETEAVPALDQTDLLPETAGDAEQVFRIAAGIDASAEETRSLRGQRGGYKETSRFEVEGRVHKRPEL